MKGKGTRVSPAEQAELDRMLLEDQIADETAAPDKLAVIVDKAHELQGVKRRIAQAEAEVERLNKERETLEFGVLPALMDEARLREFTLDDGYKILRDEAVFVSLSKDNAPTACAWLTKHGYGAIVKTQFEIVIPKGPEAPKVAAFVRTLLAKNKLEFQYSQGVHPQTLKAFVKESIEQCRKLTPTISVHQKPRAQLIEPKSKR